MSAQVALQPRNPVGPTARFGALLAVGLARLMLKRLRPQSWRRVLNGARRWAWRPASDAEVAAARDLVIAVSLRCAGPACLERSLAIALLCAARRRSVHLCVGVRTPPFESHAWVEAEGKPVLEPDDVHSIYERILTL